MAKSKLTINGYKLERQDEWWFTPDHRFKFRRVNHDSTCRAPHATINGYCWGDGKHVRVRYEAYVGDKDITVAPDGWRRLTDAIEYALREYNSEN